jgi:quinoprotein glucose dehydrogenase
MSRINELIAITAATLVVGVAHTTVAGSARVQTPPDAPAMSSGIFTDVQARRGERIVSIYCSGCHGADLEGGDSGPKLVGPTFLNNWQEKTVWDLFDWVKTNMPSDSPGSLTLENTANVIAYVLEMNKANPGSKELPGDRAALSQLKIADQIAPK